MQLTDVSAESLIAAAIGARDHAYAAYSKFQVGAAVLANTGGVYAGCNVENASYGLTICAERVAACNAISAGASSLVAVAVAASGMLTPCGSCRQFLAEFGPGMTVLLVDPASASTCRTTLDVLLPERFQFEAAREDKRGTTG